MLPRLELMPTGNVYRGVPGVAVAAGQRQARVFGHTVEAMPVSTGDPKPFDSTCFLILM